MNPFKKGSDVRQAVAPIAGKVADVKYDADENKFTYLVDYTNEDGEPAQRWFNHENLEEVV